ncbi:regulatory LacI family protein [Kribbella pratensis]|uniref:Regulatory LacI family protein n=1 Tax=Kribbella pratensis TaxID=2512112 RepID=A0ABY2F755_9ACTN|nr:LacI family DNA-binding transcriptional regulator [Kribbella pratensis]TDW84212.1 regulatory LacI family protein [Kribbella pratensis]
MSAPRRKLAVVAREAGVSISTVSKVLRAYPDVAPATRTRVREVLRRAGYPLDSDAAGNRREESELVDVVVASRSNGWTGDVLADLADAAREPGLALVVTTVNGGEPVPRLWLERLFARGTRGVIGLNVEFTDTQVAYLAAYNIPSVLLPADSSTPVSEVLTTILDGTPPYPHSMAAG